MRNVKETVGVLSITLLVTMLFPSAGYAKTYYVDAGNPKAADANAGTLTAPWNTIQHAADKAEAGDTIIVKAGVYDEKVSVKVSGKTEKPVTLRAEPTRKARVKGFVLEGDLISIEGFEITNDEADAHGIFAGEAHRENARKGCRMIGNYIHDIGGTAVISGTDALVKGNLMKNVLRGVFVNSRTLVEDNEVDTLLVQMIEKKGEIRPKKTQYAFFAGEHIVFRSNYFHGTPMKDMAKMGVDFFVTWDAWIFGSSHDILIENNRCFNATHASEPETKHLRKSSRITYRNNLFGNTVYVGIVCKWWSDITIENNTFINCGAYPVWIQSKRETEGTVIRNNLIAYYKHTPLPGHKDSESGIRIDTEGAANVDCDYNMFWGCKNHGYGKHDFVAEPQFADPANGNFRLKEGSPGIDVGTTIEGIKTDLRGIKRPQGKAYDIGAYEYTPGKGEF